MTVFHSFSQYRTHAQCPLQWSFSRRWEPKITPLYFVEGRVMGQVLDLWYGKPGSTMKEGTDIIWEAREERLRELHSSGIATTQDFQESVNKFEFLSEIASGYFRTVLTLDRAAWETLEVQKEITVPLWRGQKLVAILDGVWKNRVTGEIFIVEHKYKASLDEDLLSLDRQISTYVLAMVKNHGVLRTIYNVIRKRRERLGKNETNEDFVRRVEASIRSDENEMASLSPGVVSGGFESPLVTRIVETRSWVDLDFSYAENIAQSRAIRSGPIYRNVGDHCERLCPYRSLCPNVDPTILEREYRPRSSRQRTAVSSAKSGDGAAPSLAPQELPRI